MSPTRHRDGLRYGRDALAGLGGALAIAVAARLTFPLPGTELPQSAQTLAVLLVGATLGMRRGSLAVGSYLLVGALGLPVFADGGRGLETVLGPSGGYLLGFLVAAAGVGRFADRDELARPRWRTLLVMLAAHGGILALGGIGLVPRVGVTQAWSSGVAPFLVGGAVKSGIAAAVVWVVARRATRAPQPRTDPVPPRPGAPVRE